MNHLFEGRPGPPIKNLQRLLRPIRGGPRIGFAAMSRRKAHAIQKLGAIASAKARKK